MAKKGQEIKRVRKLENLKKVLVVGLAEKFKYVIETKLTFLSKKRA